MAGASLVHNLIVANLIRELGKALDGGRCRVFASDLRIAINPNSHFVYADVSVICDQPEFVDDRSDTVTNPRMIVEVLSESTEKYDRGFKFQGYRSMPSVEIVVFVSQDKCLVELFVRTQNGEWKLSEVRTLDGALSIDSLSVSLVANQIYRGVDFS